jgi:hypothetical protein
MALLPTTVLLLENGAVVSHSVNVAVRSSATMPHRPAGFSPDGQPSAVGMPHEPALYVDRSRQPEAVASTVMKMVVSVWNAAPTTPEELTNLVSVVPAMVGVPPPGPAARYTPSARVTYSSPARMNSHRVSPGCICCVALHVPRLM